MFEFGLFRCGLGSTLTSDTHDVLAVYWQLYTSTTTGSGIQNVWLSRCRSDRRHCVYRCTVSWIKRPSICDVCNPASDRVLCAGHLYYRVEWYYAVVIVYSVVFSSWFIFVGSTGVHLNLNKHWVTLLCGLLHFTLFLKPQHYILRTAITAI